MTEKLTLALVILLALERTAYYFAIAKKKDVIIILKSFWDHLLFWKPIQDRIRKKVPHFEENEELFQKWRNEVVGNILNTGKIIKAWDDHFHLRHRTRLSPEEEESLKLSNETQERINKSRKDFQLNWLKTEHPKFYWLKKLRII